MGCKSCKQKNNGVTVKDLLPKENNENKTILTRIFEYLTKFVLFLILLAIFTPFIIPILAVALYYTVVMSKAIDLMPLLKFLSKKIFRKVLDDEKDEDDEDDEYGGEDFNPEDYELDNPYDIVDVKQPE